MSVSDVSADASARQTRLVDLVREIPGCRWRSDALGEVAVTGVHHDSRAVEPGDLFVARKGARSDGASFVSSALERGAVAVLCGVDEVDTSNVPVPVIEAWDLPRALAFAAAAVYGHPTFGVDVVGITGTNGKTTTSLLLTAALEAFGYRPGVIGTLGGRFENLSWPSPHTSPEADELARLVREMKDRGATHVTMEVSSIALSAKRADAVRFHVAAFTNLTQDHLDYHGSMDAYAEAKARLFSELGPASGVVNMDDPFGQALSTRVVYGSRLYRYSAEVGAGARVEVSPESLRLSASGIDMVVRTPNGPVEVRSSLLGSHNVENLLCAISCALLCDASPEAISKGLSRTIVVPGRLERCDQPPEDDVVVVVDYAHTPDALLRVLRSMRATTAGRLICLFGCGGDRDPRKRPLMGAAVGEHADVAIVTNDNPRSEDPRAIAEQILPGLTPSGIPHEIILDRRAAIFRALEIAKTGDTVVLAGKGHEPYQVIGTETFPFDDRRVAQEALRKRRGSH